MQKSYPLLFFFKETFKIIKNDQGKLKLLHIFHVICKFCDTQKNLNILYA